MSQHDYIIADAAGAAFLADLNLAVKALAENNYGTTEPAVMYAHMWWADTTADILKKRNAANTGWISYLTLSTGALLGQGLGTPASGVLTNCTGAPALTGTNITGTAAGLNIGGNAANATNAGNAATVTVDDAASDTTTWIMLARSQTGNQAPATDSGISYNASSNTLAVTNISASYGLFYSATDQVLEVVSDSTTKAAMRISTQNQPSGPNVVGDMYVTTAGVLKICTVAGSPGTWVSVGAQT